MTTRSKPIVAANKSAVPYGEFLDIIAALFVLTVGVSLWVVGAHFTIMSLMKIGVPLSSLDAGTMLIPLGISVLELRYWPGAKQTQVKVIAMLLVGGFDLLSTAYGIYIWFPGKVIPLGMGYTMPADGLALFIPVFLLSLILTFGPERIIIWACKEIKAKWSGNA